MAGLVVVAEKVKDPGSRKGLGFGDPLPYPGNLAATMVGDITPPIDREEEHMVKSFMRDGMLKQLDTLRPAAAGADHLERLARFLDDVPAAWESATSEQRNKLARCLFDEVWLEDKTVVAVKPRPVLGPFFRLNYEEFVNRNIEGDVPRSLELAVTYW